MGVKICLRDVARGGAISFLYPPFLPMVATLAATAFLWLNTADARADALTAPDAYKLGPSDQILIQVFGEEDLSMDFA